MLRFSVIGTLLLLIMTFGSEAFIAPRQPAFVSTKLYSDKEGGAALAKPAVKIGQKTAVETKTVQKVEVKKRAQTGEPVTRKEEDFEEAPLYKVMLLGDDGYDRSHVIERVCAIMEDLDEDAVATIFEQAQISGKAMCGKYPIEHAELYKEQLMRSDPMIFADLEEENA
jgi:ATP-dependent Clp protease adapter protein ClpS